MLACPVGLNCWIKLYISHIDERNSCVIFTLYSVFVVMKWYYNTLLPLLGQLFCFPDVPPYFLVFGLCLVLCCSLFFYYPRYFLQCGVVHWRRLCQLYDIFGMFVLLFCLGSEDCCNDEWCFQAVRISSVPKMMESSLFNNCPDLGRKPVLR